MSWVSDEWGRDADLVEDVCFRMSRVQGFTDLTQIVVSAVGASIPDSANRDYLAVVASHAAVDVGIPLCLIL